MVTPKPKVAFIHIKKGFMIKYITSGVLMVVRLLATFFTSIIEVTNGILVASLEPTTKTYCGKSKPPNNPSLLEVSSSLCDVVDTNEPPSFAMLLRGIAASRALFLCGFPFLLLSTK
jgi:hypothetical protein